MPEADSSGSKEFHEATPQTSELFFLKGSGAYGFERVTAGCPVPIVMAGGKKLPELAALTMAYNAIQQGAAGVDMGRNIFQSDAPIAMLQAVRAVVHEGHTPAQGLEVYETLRREPEALA